MNRLIRWPLVLVLGFALIGTIGCGSGGSSGGEDNSSQTDTDLIVQQVLPTNGQEVATDLKGLPWSSVFYPDVIPQLDELLAEP